MTSIPELPERLVNVLRQLAARDAGEGTDSPALTVESVLSALYVAWPTIRLDAHREVDAERRAIVPRTGSLDSVFADIEDMAECCAGGNGSANDLRRNGRGEGLREAVRIFRERWPAIRADVARQAMGERDAEVDRLGAEIDRLAAWLRCIEGGEDPCRDEARLRQWAYEAVTLGRPVPGSEP